MQSVQRKLWSSWTALSWRVDRWRWVMWQSGPMAPLRLLSWTATSWNAPGSTWEPRVDCSWWPDSQRVRPADTCKQITHSPVTPSLHIFPLKNTNNTFLCLCVNRHRSSDPPCGSAGSADEWSHRYWSHGCCVRYTNTVCLLIVCVSAASNTHQPTLASQFKQICETSIL